jgi:sirohydrochlorin cobaltochelatase
VVVGHGSHLSHESAAPVYTHARAIRDRGLFDEVQEAFWKEEPALGDVLDMLTSDQIYVVPVFLADGYFTRLVVPRELGLSESGAGRSAQRVVYCPPVGAHPRMEDLVLARALETCGLDTEERRAAALVIIGHGTERAAASGGTVHRLTARLAARREFGVVRCGFLDQDPRIEAVLESLGHAHVVLVPFFIAEGWHTRTTIPRDLHLAGTHTRRAGSSIWYAPPIGTLPQVADVILDLTAGAGARLHGR